MTSDYIFKLASTPQEIDAYFELRKAIFVEEQYVFEENDVDEIDAIAYPIVAINPENNQVVGVVRIYETEKGIWYGGRLGTHKDYRRGWQIGKGLIYKAVTTANTWGCDRFFATVQIQNVRFFQRLHWESLKEMSICDRPHHFMEADLNFYPPIDEIRPVFPSQIREASQMLVELAAKLRQSMGILHKQDIQITARGLGEQWNEAILLGDDCAAIRDRDGYLLLAAEGMLPQLIETDPWFAGWCSVMVNVSDIYSMGGEPIAVVDTLWSQSTDSISELLAGMKAAAIAYQVPIVGGHTNCRSPYNALSVAILGRAQKLLTSFNAQPNDVLLAAIDMRGQFHPDYPFWNAATKADPQQLRENLSILPYLAKSDLCDTAKDISMGGIIGTLLMLTETSTCGAILELDQIPCPENVLFERWLISFPSYGFLLNVRPENVEAVQTLFHAQDLVCAVVGEIQANTEVILRSQGESTLFWDFSQQSLTGFSDSFQNTSPAKTNKC